MTPRMTDVVLPPTFEQTASFTPGQLAEQRAELLTALTNAVATIDAIYQWLDRVEKQGGAKSIAGVAACHAMLTSLRKNADRTTRLVIEPALAAIAAAKGGAL